MAKGNGNGGDTTEQKQGKSRLRPPWQPGQSGNPSGRPKTGTNVKAQILESFNKFEFKGKYGMEAFMEWGKQSPGQYFKIIASLLPKDVEVTGGLDLSTLAHDIEEARARLNGKYSH